MSRIGKKPVTVPSGVTVTVADRTISVKGPKGTLALDITEEVSVAVEGAEVIVSPVDENDNRSRAMWGTVRARVANMVDGVSTGFSRNLELVGVGYRAAVKGKDLELNLGFSHPVVHKAPEGITFTCAKPTEVKIEGVDKQSVGQVAAEIRSYRPPEPYKGKGIRYEGEHVRRKEGKKK
ncbi:50S ribosomal protein L6 [Hirschia litorea]|uniref:Large ribosomal subunit protein uL6 n=1 Tax=Hirschia litorea TaxID=1199156 RepID=A0ABW2IGF3_9PROT